MSRFEAGHLVNALVQDGTLRVATERPTQPVANRPLPHPSGPGDVPATPLPVVPHAFVQQHDDGPGAFFGAAPATAAAASRSTPLVQAATNLAAAQQARRQAEQDTVRPVPTSPDPLPIPVLDPGTAEFEFAAPVPVPDEPSPFAVPTDVEADWHRDENARATRVAAARHDVDAARAVSDAADEAVDRARREADTARVALARAERLLDEALAGPQDD
jgi:hypothetical protein